MKMSTVLISAYAKAPQNTPMYENNKSIGVLLEIHKENHYIVKADFTFLTDLTCDYVRRLVVGTDFSKDISSLIKDVENNCLMISQNALIVALKIAHQKYHDSCLNKKE